LKKVALILKDVLQIPILKVAKLLTDQEVAKQQYITSISVIEVPVGRFVRPGEFVLTTGMNVGQNARLLADFVREIAEARAAALAIAIGTHTPGISQSVIDVANRLKLPLIELPWELRFSEISEAVLREIIQETNRIRSRDEFVWSLASRHVEENAAIEKGRQLGFDFSRKVVGIVATLSNLSGQSAQSGRADADARLVERLCARMATQNHLHWLGTVIGDTVVGYLEVPRTRQRIHSLLAGLQPIVVGRCTVSWGVGRICGEFPDFAKSYEDARIACELGMRTRGKSYITDVSDVLADRVLLNLQRDAQASMLLNRYIEPLSRLQRIPLVPTLEMFFDTDCNASETARKLSISRQSLLYRLKKIENILNIDLHDSDSRFAIVLSLRIHKLQRHSTVQKQKFGQPL
jgi:sugar diacid utilization regulator